MVKQSCGKGHPKIGIKISKCCLPTHIHCSLTTVKAWRQPTGPSTDGWIKEVWWLHNRMLSHRKETLPWVAAWTGKPWRCYSRSHELLVGDKYCSSIYIWLRSSHPQRKDIRQFPETKEKGVGVSCHGEEFQLYEMGMPVIWCATLYLYNLYQAPSHFFKVLISSLVLFYHNKNKILRLKRYSVGKDTCCPSVGTWILICSTHVNARCGHVCL